MLRVSNLSSSLVQEISEVERPGSRRLLALYGASEVLGLFSLSCSGSLPFRSGATAILMLLCIPVLCLTLLELVLREEQAAAVETVQLCPRLTVRPLVGVAQHDSVGQLSQ